jgi:4-amino-4-deoxy-L-arabinose transferase-like glycosyltransferase
MAPIKHSRSRITVLIFAALALPYFLNLGANSLWDTKETYEAETAREMLGTSNYLAPMFNYQPRTEKPPLTYWLVVLSYKAFGVREFSVRVPGALAAIGVLFFTYRIALLLFSRWAALASVLILGTTSRFFILARKDPLDTVLLFWLAGTAYYLLRSHQDDSLRAWSLAWISAGLGFMTKGPVAWLIPAASYLLSALWLRSRRVALSRIMLGILVFLAVTAPWYLLTYLRYGDLYITPFFVDYNLGRFFSQSYGPARGPLYYCAVFAVDFFPWSLLSLAAIRDLWAQRKSVDEFRTWPYAFLIVWCAFVFVLFSFSKNKQEYYITPIYPMLSVLIAGMFDKSVRQAESGSHVAGSRLWNWSFLAAGVLILAMGVVLFVVTPAVRADLPTALLYLPPVGLLLVSIAPAVFAIRRKLAAGIAGLAVPIYFLLLLVALIYLPAIAPLYPVKDLCAVIEAQSGPQDEAGYYQVALPSMVFYLRRPIFEELDAEAMVRRFQGPQRVFCVLTEQNHNFFVAQRDLVLYVLDRRERLVTQFRPLLDESRAIGQELVLVSNRPFVEPESAANPIVP